MAASVCRWVRIAVDTLLVLLESYMFAVLLLPPSWIFNQSTADSFITEPWRTRRVFFVLIVPCKNEARVICYLLESLLWGLMYPQRRYHVLVMEDGSTDGTYERVQEWLRERRVPGRRCSLHRRAASGKFNVADGGKSAVLNAAVRAALPHVPLWMAHSGCRLHDVVFGFVDADAMVEEKLLEVVSWTFAARLAEAVQVCRLPLPARANGLLAGMQHAEYLADRYLARRRRVWHPDGADLRGNGMFLAGSVVLGALSRCRCLEHLRIFHEATTGDDVDLTCRLRMAGMRVRYEDRACVYEETAHSWRQLFLQRVRWMYGGYRRYVDYLTFFVCPGGPSADQLAEMLVLLLPLALTGQGIAAVAARIGSKPVTLWPHVVTLAGWSLLLQVRACGSWPLAMAGFLFSLQRAVLVGGAAATCIWRAHRPIPYCKTDHYGVAPGRSLA
ncbi:hypothetical protein CDCA_CDCA02G0522 [Cyanidium caldarium]|uniref:Uncharacterized protein n=1 Tax=Cyanidium caldarium TaxID=2771 RepID=A0AAV9IQE4_CYACA|nr:hypothetical protein CDCA_CDCA02G0522 [Cyanidium caldarium]